MEKRSNFPFFVSNNAPANYTNKVARKSTWYSGVASYIKFDGMAVAHKNIRWSIFNAKWCRSFN